METEEVFLRCNSININIIFIVNLRPTKPLLQSISPTLNTLLYILTKENGYRELKNVHRIDKNTSGICLLVIQFLLSFPEFLFVGAVT